MGLLTSNYPGIDLRSDHLDCIALHNNCMFSARLIKYPFTTNNFLQVISTIFLSTISITLYLFLISFSPFSTNCSFPCDIIWYMSKASSDSDNEWYALF